MGQLNRVAYHEAAHIVATIAAGLEIPDAGIDLNRPSSVDGAFGSAWVNFFDVTKIEDEPEKLVAAIWNASICCAGAVSDAKILEIELRDALRQQPGDEKHAQLCSAEILKDQEEQAIAVFMEQFIAKALRTANDVVTRNWSLVKALAEASEAKKGCLNKADIQSIVKEIGLKSQ